LFGTAKDYHVVAFIYGRIGVGAGLVVNGQLYRGAGAGAGEIGHTLLVCQTQEQSTLTPLEKLVSEPAILSRAEELTGKSYTFGALIEAAREGDETLLSILDERAFYLGIALANMVNIFNPDLIVLGGIFREAEDLILNKVRSIVKQYAFANLGERVEIHVTPFANEAGMIGSAALALDAFFYRPQAFQREVQS
jgi:predicted NBD/HSP70 family sugar kinase